VDAGDEERPGDEEGGAEAMLKSVASGRGLISHKTARRSSMGYQARGRSRVMRSLSVKNLLEEDKGPPVLPPPRISMTLMVCVVCTCVCMCMCMCMWCMWVHGSAVSVCLERVPISLYMCTPLNPNGFISYEVKMIWNFKSVFGTFEA
jgi:hypothetical protein